MITQELSRVRGHIYGAAEKPVNPPAGQFRLFTRADGVYRVDSAGVVTAVGKGKKFIRTITIAVAAYGTTAGSTFQLDSLTDAQGNAYPAGSWQIATAAHSGGLSQQNVALGTSIPWASNATGTVVLTYTGEGSANGLRSFAASGVSTRTNSITIDFEGDDANFVENFTGNVQSRALATQQEFLSLGTRVTIPEEQYTNSEADVLKKKRALTVPADFAPINPDTYPFKANDNIIVLINTATAPVINNGGDLETALTGTATPTLTYLGSSAASGSRVPVFLNTIQDAVFDANAYSKAEKLEISVNPTTDRKLTLQNITSAVAEVDGVVTAISAGAAAAVDYTLPKGTSWDVFISDGAKGVRVKRTESIPTAVPFAHQVAQQLTGQTWIDGRPIWIKSIYRTAISSNNAKQVIFQGVGEMVAAPSITLIAASGTTISCPYNSHVSSRWARSAGGDVEVYTDWSQEGQVYATGSVWYVL